MEVLIRDVRHAIRAFRENSLFAATVVVALALGIGANTAIFSVINAVVLKPVPFPEADRLVQLVHTGPNGEPGSTGGSPARYLLWREQTEVIEDIAAYRSVSFNYTGGETPEHITASQVTEPYFRTFRAPLALGRSFTVDEDLPGAPKTTVISFGFWTQRLGGNPDAIGTTLSLNGVPYTVIGVAAAEFDPREFGDIDVWVPFQLDPNTRDDGESLMVAARLVPGVSLEQAQARLASSITTYRERFPTTSLQDSVGFGVVLFQDAMIGTGSSTLFRNDPRNMLWLLFGAVGFVLLIACTNVAGLMLIRASARDREIAVRSALGAQRSRIVRQFFTEGVLLAAVGGTSGLVLGHFGMRALLAIDTAGLPRLGEAGTLLRMDWHVVGFTILISVATATLFSLLPALAVSRTEPASVIKSSSGRSGTGFRTGRTRPLLVVAEVSLAIVLLIGAALLIRTTLALYQVDPGFNVDDVVVMRTPLPEQRFHTSSAIQELSTSTLERVRAIPNVEAAAAGCCVPLHRSWGAVFKITGRDDEGRPFSGGGDVTISTGDYFDTFQIPVVRGRTFNERDDSRSVPVVVINRALAERWWPNGRDPLGEKMLLGDGSSATADEPVRQVIGIVENVRKARLDIVRPTMYVPLAQIPETWLEYNLGINPLVWIVRANVDPMQLSAVIRNEIQRTTGAPVVDVQPMREIVSVSISRQRANTVLMTLFGGVALLLAAVGIYGLIAFSVQQRTHEIGIRIALGARRHRVMGMVVCQGALLVAIGTAIGVAAAFFLADLLASFLFGVEPRDTVAFVGVPAILMVVAIAAVAIPALRASRVDPLSALRYD